MKRLSVICISVFVLTVFADDLMGARSRSKSYSYKSSSRTSIAWKPAKQKVNTRANVSIPVSKPNKVKIKQNLAKKENPKPVRKTQQPDTRNNFANKLNQQRKQEKAKFSYNNFKQKAKAPTKDESQVFNTRVQRIPTKELRNIKSTKHTYYTTHRYEPPVVVINNSPPAFGIYDGLFMWAMLDNISDMRYRNMMYHNQNDPAFREWRREANRLAEENADIRAQLRQMDAEMAAMKGQPIDPNYTPQDIPAAVMYNEDILNETVKERSTMRLATASKTGNYYRVGRFLSAKSSEIRIQVIDTRGSMHNLDLLHENKVDGAFVQNDAFKIYQERFPSHEFVVEQANLYKEYVHVIARSDSNVDRLKDLTSKHIIYVGPIGSGSYVTWKNFCEINPSYQKVNVEPLPISKAITKVMSNPNAVIFYVSGLNSRAVQKANATKKFKLVAIKDSKLDKATDAFGYDLYDFATINNSYNNISDGFWGTKTIVVDSTLVLSADWFEDQGPSVYENFTKLIDNNIEAIRKVVR